MSNWEGRRVVVTGGAGFIGSRITRRLVEAGAQVVAADDMRSGTAQNLAAGGARLVEVSLDSDDLAPLLEGTDTLFHCAGSAYVPPSVENPLFDFGANLGLVLRILDWLRLHSPRTRTIIFSSAAVYGNPRTLPVSEDHPLDPISPYGVSKLAAERYGAVFARLYQMPIASLRLFSVYGPGQRKQVVFDLVNRMLEGNGSLEVIGDGNQVRDFCFVEDAAAAALAVAAAAPLQGEVYNVGTGRGVTVRELVQAIAEALELQARPTYSGVLRPGDAQGWVADVTRIRELGWSPATELEQGLRLTGEWIRHAVRG